MLDVVLSKEALIHRFDRQRSLEDIQPVSQAIPEMVMKYVQSNFKITLGRGL